MKRDQVDGVSLATLIDRTAEHVRTTLSGEGTGHDWWHTYRVSRTARRLGQAKGADLLVVELAALLHDIADWKAHGGDSTVGPQAASDWLDSLAVDRSVVEHVCRIITDISFSYSHLGVQPRRCVVVRTSWQRVTSGA